MTLLHKLIGCPACKFSVTFACAIALLEGRASEAEFSDAAVARGDVRALMSRISKTA